MALAVYRRRVRQRIDEAFEGDFKLRFHLAPPLLAGRDPNTGRPKKQEFGAWMLWVFRALAACKGLRGTRWDPFGYTAERRAERRIRDRYLADIERLAAGLTADSLALATEIAAASGAHSGLRPGEGKGHRRSGGRALAPVRGAERRAGAPARRLKGPPMPIPLKLLLSAVVAWCRLGDADAGARGRRGPCRLGVDRAGGADDLRRLAVPGHPPASSAIRARRRNTPASGDDGGAVSRGQARVGFRGRRMCGGDSVGRRSAAGSASIRSCHGQKSAYGHGCPRSRCKRRVTPKGQSAGKEPRSGLTRRSGDSRSVSYVLNQDSILRSKMCAVILDRYRCRVAQ